MKVFHLIAAAALITGGILSGQTAGADVQRLVRLAAESERAGAIDAALQHYSEIRRTTPDRALREYCGERARAIYAGKIGQGLKAPDPPKPIAKAKPRPQAAPVLAAAAVAKPTRSSRDPKAADPPAPITTSSPAPPAESMEQMFNQGMARMVEGNFAAAQQQFETMLAREPALPRVKLELALCHEQQGNPDRALALYEEVLAAQPPEAVAENIRRRSEAIQASASGGGAVVDASRKLNSSAVVMGGFLYDTNVNAGPETDSVLIFNLPFQLSEDAKPSSDVGYQVSAAVSTTYQLWDRWAVEASVSHFRVDYDEQDRFDYDQFSASLGLRTGGRDWSLSLPFRYSRNWLGDDPYGQSVALIPSFQKQVGEGWVSTSSLYAALSSNDQVSARDGGSLLVSQGLRYAPDPQGWFATGRLYYGHEFAEVDFLSSNQVGISAGWFVPLGDRLNFFVEPGFRYVQYEGDEPLFGTTREEPQFVLNVNLGYDLPWWGLNFALGYTYTNNGSEIDLYQYQRNQLTALLRKEF